MKTEKNFLKIGSVIALFIVAAVLTFVMAANQSQNTAETSTQVAEISKGYQIEHVDNSVLTKCGEGKCGDGESKDADADKKCGEGKCGEGKKADKKCGEGKCGDGDAKEGEKESKCGEGKCG